MKAHQRLVANDGYEVLLFPLEYMYVSQGEGGSTSHQGTYNIDFLGWGRNGRIYNCPYYAPCKCKLVYQNQTSASNVWESVDEVHTPIGLIKVCFEVVHDDNLPHTLGDVVNQGEVLGHTGSSGFAYGDHVHLNTARGTYEGQEQVPPDNQWQLKNSEHIYSMMYINDTNIVNDGGYSWTTYQGGVVPTSRSFNKFPWVLYARKLRKKRM